MRRAICQISAMKVAFYLIGVFPLFLCASASAATTLPPPSATAPAPVFSQSEIAEAWGRVVAHESEADQFRLSDSERAAIQRGVDLALRGQPVPKPLDLIYNDVARFLDVRRGEVRATKKARNLADYPAWFATLRQRPGIIVRPSGLCYLVRQPGSGPRPRPDQTVTVKYTASLPDGTTFDSTEQMGPVDLVLGKQIRGWSEGLQQIGVGGRIALYVPPPLAFGDDKALEFGIPPASTVIAEFELLAIKSTPPEDPPPPPAPAPPPPSPAGFPPDEVAATWGWILAHERGAVRAQLDDSARESFLRGFAAALHGEAAPFDERTIRPQVAQFVAARQEAVRQNARQKQLAQNAAFFAQLAKNPHVIRLPSGLCYEILQPGTGPFPTAKQRVRVNYIGRLINGSVFDRTDPTMGPLDIDIGSVIAGWTEGMQKINRGGRIKLYIPPDLAYGDNSGGNIPPASTLIFEIELIEIMDRPPPDSASPATGAK